MLAGGCSGGGTAPPHIALAPLEIRLAMGSTAPLVATVTDGVGAPIANVVTWSSSNEAVATVDAKGLVFGAAAGTAQISATVKGTVATASLTVAPAVRVNLFTASHVLVPGREAAVTAKVLDAANQELVASIVWTSSNPAIATVTPDGRTRAAALGFVTVTAETVGAVGRMTMAVQEALHGRIAFVSEREPPYGDVVPYPDGGIYLMTADGGSALKKFSYAQLGCNPDRPGSAPYCPFPISAPTFDADGLRIAFVAQVYREIEFPVVTVIELCSSGPVLCHRLDFPSVTRPPGPNMLLSGVGAPAFSPNGQWLAFAYGSNTIAVWDLASGTFNNVDVGAPAGEPAWSPDGHRIAYVVGSSGDRAIWLMNSDGGGRIRLSAVGSDDSHPSWSPDGLHIVFSGIAGGNSDVYVMNADGSGLANLTNHPAQDRNPVWSPDGRFIAFDTDRDGNREIYVMGVGGSTLVNLTRNPAADFSPSWSP